MPNKQLPERGVKVVGGLQLACANKQLTGWGGVNVFGGQRFACTNKQLTEMGEGKGFWWTVPLVRKQTAARQGW